MVQDDPDIRTQLPRARNPLRIVIDGMARSPLQSRLLLRPAAGTKPETMVVVTRFAPEDRIRDLQEAGAEVLVAPEEGDIMAANVNLDRLLGLLGRRDITSILVEGEGTLADALLSAGLVDKLYLYMHPTILGGTSSPSLVGGTGASFLEEGRHFSRMSARPVGPGLLVEAYALSR
jgi:diaminohydroxyphosphoribosylaminopyrimidine deaminase/5-amino-6-(5-phosphoribosylamino)uracil reductase